MNEIDALTNEIVEVGEVAVVGRYLIFAVDDAELGRVLERMLVEAEHKQDTAERPHVHLCVDAIVAVQVEHLGRAIHRRRVLGHLVLDETPLVGRPRVVRREHLGRRAAEVAQLNLVVLRYEEVLELIFVIFLLLFIRIGIQYLLL